MIDHYELLQISPKADLETIHRVYRYLAARLHPDNAKTGDAAKFRQVKTAYEVLAHPMRRMEYDAMRSRTPSQAQPPLSSTIDFMDQFEGETNRRMAVLAVLYYQRRVSPNHPEVSLAEIEERMGFPRDYLDFTLWYLVKKKYLERTDSVTYSLTAEGVDFVEKERSAVPLLNGLLNTSSSAEPVQDHAEAAASVPDEAPASTRPAHGSGPLLLPASARPLSTPAKANRRTGKKDRRESQPDLRILKVERRSNTRNRRANANLHPAAR